MAECGKRKFPSKRAAHEAVQTMGNTVRVYWCDECRAFHSTKERGGGASSARSWNARAERSRRHRRANEK